MSACGSSIEFGKTGGPEHAGDFQEIRRQLPPLGVIAGIEMRERLPFLFFRIHRIDHFAKRARQPYGVGRAGGGDQW